MIAACQFCEGSRFSFFNHLDSLGNNTTIYKCIRCGHGSYEKRYSEMEFQETYAKTYSEDYLTLTSETFKQRNIQYGLDRDLLLSLLDREINSVLDIGCSSGGYLDSMPEEWVKSGFEVNQTYIDFLSTERPNFKIYSDLNLVNEKYDLITMRGVIEHIQDLEEMSLFLKEHLNPSASVFISATPDFSSPCATLYGDAWSQIVAPEHIQQFTPASLSIFMSKSGLTLKSINHPYLGTPYANWPSDKLKFNENLEKLGRDLKVKPTLEKHPFAGNMMSLLYVK
jgi:hypothetical protein